MPGNKRTFSEHLPAMLGGFAALITAIAALVAAWPKSDVVPDAASNAKPISGNSTSLAASPHSIAHQGQSSLGLDPASGNIPRKEATSGSTERSRQTSSQVAPKEVVQMLNNNQVSSQGITLVAPAILWRRAVVFSGRVELYLRSEPNDSANKVTRITPNVVFKVANLRNGWWEAEVLPAGAKGYVDERFIRIVDQ
jgi:hypothetical protein